MNMYHYYRFFIFCAIFSTFYSNAAEHPLVHQRSHQDQQPTNCWQQTIWRSLQSPRARNAGRIVLYSSIIVASVISIYHPNTAMIPICEPNVCWQNANQPWQCIYQCPDYVNDATTVIPIVSSVWSAVKLGNELGEASLGLRSRLWHWYHREILESPPDV